MTRDRCFAANVPASAEYQFTRGLAIGIHRDPGTPYRFGRINCGYYVAFEIPGSEGTWTGTQFIAIHADAVSVQVWDE